MTTSPTGPVPMPCSTIGAAPRKPGEAVQSGWVTHAEAGEPQAAIEVHEVKWGTRVATKGPPGAATVMLKRGVVAEPGKRHVELGLQDAAGGTTVLRGAQVVSGYNVRNAWPWR